MKTLKSVIAGCFLGANIILGNPNKAEAQNYENIEFYNHDNDDFPEEIVGYKGQNLEINSYFEKVLYNPHKMELTIIHYLDKDNDNFHESIKVFNCDRIFRLIIEHFYIDKNSGTIVSSFERYPLTMNKWRKNYSGKPFLKIMQENFHKNLRCLDKRVGKNLTVEGIYALYPNWFQFYGGFGERVKKLIIASKNKLNLKEMISDERDFWKSQ